ncbi:MAG: ferric reductase-like transmembrane domain-containing protein [Verrucomicrobiota bacterium]|nr:ferric reductase-like transmembrane domain-containing protein [Verrucomicrobiota bacterium]
MSLRDKLAFFVAISTGYLLFPFSLARLSYTEALTPGLAFVAFILITLALLIGPLHVILKKWPLSPHLLQWRRVIGSTSAVLLSVHLLLLWALRYEFVPSKALSRGWPTFLILHAAFIYIFLMGATSSNRAVSWMGFRTWKVFHRGIYILYPMLAAASLAAMVIVHCHWSLLVATFFLSLSVPILQVWAFFTFRSRPS